MKSKNLPFYLVIVALFIGITSPALFADGMFMDGLLYAAISKNLAHNLGSFWDLHLTNTLYPHFHEHPPLAIGLQSLFFRLFGDDMLVERFYSFITFIITGWIMTRIWKKITNIEFYYLAWLPLLFWISITLVSWAASNNLLENTMMIFTSLSILFLLKSLEAKRFLYLSLSGIMLFLGFLTKGLVAFFPLSIPFWIFIIKRDINFKRFIIDTSILCIAALIPLLLIFKIQPESLESLKAYFNIQVIESIKNVKTVDSRFSILGRLFLELFPIVVLMIFAFIFTAKSVKSFKISKWAYVFIALGLAGVIPIMISMKQRSFYILATLPIFSIALADIIAPKVHFLTHRIKTESKGFSIFRTISYLLIIASLIIAIIQPMRIGRNKDQILDIYKVIKIVHKDSTISIQDDLKTDWSLHGYFSRYANISLDFNKDSKHQFFLVLKGTTNEMLNGYKKKNIDLIVYDLYEKEKKK